MTMHRRHWLLLTLVHVGLELCRCVDIVDFPRDAVWIREGGDGTLTCSSSTPWQWCYWEIVQGRDLTEKTNLTLYEREFEGEVDPSAIRSVIQTEDGEVVEVETPEYNAKRYMTAHGAATYETQDGDVTFTNMTRNTCGIMLTDVTAEKFQVRTVFCHAFGSQDALSAPSFNANSY